MKRPEQKVQRGCVGLLDFCRKRGALEYFHVPNGGYRKKIEAAILVGLGLRSGVPDFVILLANKVVLFVELKAGRGILSDMQEYWRDWLRDHDYAWFEVRSVAELSAILLEQGAECVAEYEAPAWARVESGAG